MGQTHQGSHGQQAICIVKRVLLALCFVVRSTPSLSEPTPWFHGPVHLTCTGILHDDVSGKRRTSNLYRDNYAVDFDNRAWCKGVACTPTLPMDHVQGVRAWLSDHPLPAKACGAYEKTTFLGDDLRLSRAFGGCGEDLSVEAQCTVDRNSGQDVASSMRVRTGRRSGLVPGLYKIAHQTSGAQTIGGYLMIGKDGKMAVYAGKRGKFADGRSECYVLASGTDVDAMMQGQTLRPGKAPGGEPDHELTIDRTRVGVVDRLSAHDPIAWFYSGPHGNYKLNGDGYFVNTGARGTTFSDAPAGWQQGADTQHFTFPAAPVGWPDAAELRSWTCPHKPGDGQRP